MRNDSTDISKNVLSYGLKKNEFFRDYKRLTFKKKKIKNSTEKVRYVCSWGPEQYTMFSRPKHIRNTRLRKKQKNKITIACLSRSRDECLIKDVDE